MLPTPAKFHYIFNLRDLSRIWEGMLNVTGGEVNSRRLVLALWKNECTRVIADRFTNEQDREWFEKALQKTLQECLGDEALADLMDEPYFVDFLRYIPLLIFILLCAYQAPSMVTIVLSINSVFLF